MVDLGLSAREAAARLTHDWWWFSEDGPASPMGVEEIRDLEYCLFMELEAVSGLMMEETALVNREEVGVVLKLKTFFTLFKPNMAR